MRNRLGKSLVLFPAVDLFDAICKHMKTWFLSIISMYFILCILFFFWCIFSNFLLWKTYLFFCLCYYILCRHGNNHFDIHFWRITSPLVRKMEKTRSMKEEMDGEVFYFRQSRYYSFRDIMIKVLFPFCTLNWRVNNYVSRYGKGINRRHESTFINV